VWRQSERQREAVRGICVNPNPPQERDRTCLIFIPRLLGASNNVHKSKLLLTAWESSCNCGLRRDRSDLGQASDKGKTRTYEVM
jgi:hypothetical protein